MEDKEDSRSDMVAKMVRTQNFLRHELEDSRTQVLRLQAEKASDRDELARLRADLAEARAELEEARKEIAALKDMHTRADELYRTYSGRCDKLREKYGPGPGRKSYTGPHLLEDCVLHDPCSGSGG
jgi:predicted nuclease with TOPRIM domain